MASYFLNMRRRKTKRRNWISNFEMCASATVSETRIPRNGHALWPSECDDYAAVCDKAAMKRCRAQ